MSLVSFNHQIVPKSSLTFYEVERFRVADSCFESMLVINGEIPLLQLHLNRLIEACNVFGFDQTSISVESIQALLKANNIDQALARVRFSLIRKNGLNYTPKGNKTNILIEVEQLTSIFQEVKHLGLYTDDEKYSNKFAHLKSSNALIYVLAKKFAHENQFNDVLIRNEHNHWIEASSSNVFAIKNEQIYSSNMHTGAVHGVCQKFLSNLFEINFVDFNDAFLEDVEELFLTNAIQLIQPVVCFNNRLLKTDKTTDLIQVVKAKLEI